MHAFGPYHRWRNGHEQSAGGGIPLCRRRGIRITSPGPHNWHDTRFTPDNVAESYPYQRACSRKHTQSRSETQVSPAHGMFRRRRRHALEGSRIVARVGTESWSTECVGAKPCEIQPVGDLGRTKSNPAPAGSSRWRCDPRPSGILRHCQRCKRRRNLIE